MKSPIPETPSCSVSFAWIDPDEALSHLTGRGSWRQYPAYAQQAASRIGAESRYALFRAGDEAIALANLRTRRIPLIGQVTLLSHGPVPLRADETAGADIVASLSALRREARSLKLGQVIVDPDISLTLKGIDLSSLDPRLVPDPAGQPYRTYLMRVSQDPEELRMGFSREWRKDLGKGLRAGLEVRISEWPQDFLLLAPLLDQLSARKGFGVAQDCAFFADVANRAGGFERFLIHLISKDGELLACHIGAFSGSMAVGLLGAGSPRGLALHASRVAYWHVMATAREMGFEYYDLGGFDEAENPDVFKFKRRMGGLEIQTPGPMLLSPPGPRDKAISALRRTMKALRR